MSQAKEAAIGMKSSRQKGFIEDGVRLPQRTTTHYQGMKTQKFLPAAARDQQAPARERYPELKTRIKVLQAAARDHRRPPVGNNSLRNCFEF